MRPYFQENGVTIYHGDCRDLLPLLTCDSIVTDPVWPNASHLLTGAGDAWRLFASAMQKLPFTVRCVTVQLGVLSDPRFLLGVPDRLKFFRLCWLPMLPVSFSGRAVNGGDVAYVFGVPPGNGIIGGQCKEDGSRSLFERHHGRNRSKARYKKSQEEAPHPAPRKLGHVLWLMERFGHGVVLDPFAGAGTTLVAAQRCGLKAVGIEIEERFCELMAKRVRGEAIDSERHFKERTRVVMAEGGLFA